VVVVVQGVDSRAGVGDGVEAGGRSGLAVSVFVGCTNPHVTTGVVVRLVVFDHGIAPPAQACSTHTVNTEAANPQLLQRWSPSVTWGLVHHAAAEGL
jgi:hypothetical protein